MTEITENNFNAEIANHSGLTLVDFWAPWCAPCRAQAPILETLASERPDVKVGKVNTDNEGALAEKFGIMSIPTLIVFKDGKPARKAVGLHSLSDLKALIDG